MNLSSNTTLPAAITASPARARSGLAYCLLAVVSFSVTLPATRIATRELDPLLIGLGRGAIAGVVSIALLLVRGERLPNARIVRGLLLVGFGVVLGFPLLTALALRSLPAHHAVLVVGLSPLATGAIASLRNKEPTTPLFWLFAGTGALAVFATLAEGPIRLGSADLLLLAAVLLVALGYAEGGRLARELDGVSVTAWALVLSLPVTVGVSLFVLARDGVPRASAAALASFAYVSLVSGLVAFWAWYRGLSLGGVARGSQVQLLQPLLSLLWCSLWLGESLGAGTCIGAAAVLASVAGTRWASGRSRGSHLGAQVEHST